LVESADFRDGVEFVRIVVPAIHQELEGAHHVGQGVALIIFGHELDWNILVCISMEQFCRAYLGVNQSLQAYCKCKLQSKSGISIYSVKHPNSAI
jgi:hypothetical protein